MWLTWYSSVLLNYRTLLCWIACSLLHDVRSCIGRGGTPLVWSHHASYSHHLLCLCGRLLTSRRCWRHLSCGRTEKNSDWRENDCTWSKDLSGRVGITLRWLSNDVCLSQICGIYAPVRLSVSSPTWKYNESFKSPESELILLKGTISTRLGQSSK